MVKFLAVLGRKRQSILLWDWGPQLTYQDSVCKAPTLPSSQGSVPNARQQRHMFRIPGELLWGAGHFVVGPRPHLTAGVGNATGTSWPCLATTPWAVLLYFGLLASSRRHQHARRR